MDLKTLRQRPSTLEDRPLSFLWEVWTYVKYFDNHPSLYKDFLIYFNDLNARYNLFLTTIKEIPFWGKLFFNKQWFSRGILSINDFWIMMNNFNRLKL